MNRPKALLRQPDKTCQKGNRTENLYHHEHFLGCIQTFLYLLDDLICPGINLLDRVGVFLPKYKRCRRLNISRRHRCHRLLLERHQVIGEGSDLIEPFPLMILDIVRLETCQGDIPVLVCI